MAKNQLENGSRDCYYWAWDLSMKINFTEYVSQHDILIHGRHTKWFPLLVKQQIFT